MIAAAQPARLRMSSAVNIVWDGNSLVYGALADDSASQSPPAQLLATAPVAGSGAAVTNLGISGQTWRQMNGLDGQSSADVDAAWVAGKTNVLIAWEGTNAIFQGASASQAVQDATDYLAARLAAHGWLVVLMTTLPAQDYADRGQAFTDAYNATIDAYNQTLRRNYRAMGAHVLVDVRAAGSPWAFADYSPASFAAAGPAAYWTPAETTHHIHLNAAGYALIARMVAAGLRRLPAR